MSNSFFRRPVSRHLSTSHGGTDALGFANAIGVAVDLVQQGTNERITAEMHRLDEKSTGGQHARAS